jgi:hypothetical protein
MRLRGECSKTKTKTPFESAVDVDKPVSNMEDPQRQHDDAWC